MHAMASSPVRRVMVVVSMRNEAEAALACSLVLTPDEDDVVVVEVLRRWSLWCWTRTLHLGYW